MRVPHDAVQHANCLSDLHSVTADDGGKMADSGTGRYRTTDAVLCVNASIVGYKSFATADPRASNSLLRVLEIYFLTYLITYY